MLAENRERAFGAAAEEHLLDSIGGGVGEPVEEEPRGWVGGARDEPVPADVERGGARQAGVGAERAARACRERLPFR